MTLYQTLALFIFLLYSWNLIRVVYAVIHEKSFIAEYEDRFLFAMIVTNLALAFLGTPW